MIESFSKTAIAVRHVAFEDLGSFASVLTEARYKIAYLDAGLEPWPMSAMLEADLLVVLGGPIGVYEEKTYPFLQGEIEVLRRRLAARRPTLGICLGAQLMARALGAGVYPGTKEIGFAPVTLSQAGRSTLAELADVRVLHWHGDTFDLPDGAELLASTAACRNQAFAIGAYALAFQFHCEAGGASLEQWLIGHAVELAQAGVDPVRLRADNSAYAASVQAAGTACLRRWIAGLEVTR